MASSLAVAESVNPSSPPNSIPARAPVPYPVEIDELIFAYPDGHTALRGVSLRVAAGEKVALVGPNGAGKSTLLLHLNGILRGQGRICVGGFEMPAAHHGKDVAKKLGKIRAAVGLVFQNPDDQLFSPTVFDDVAFGPLHIGLPEALVRERVEAALAAVGMSDYIDRTSHHLSIGEKKRIAIATVLSMHPQILVLDEPTAGLDPRARRNLIQLLQSLDLTMLISTHDIRMVGELLPRTAIMDGGLIVADGPTDYILGDAALLEKHGLEII
jgi:cobalt transport protein ATP-binding subunit